MAIFSVTTAFVKIPFIENNLVSARMVKVTSGFFVFIL